MCRCRMFEEFDHLRTFEGARVKPEVKVPDCHPAMTESFFPVEVELQDRGLPRGAQVRTRCGFWLNPLSSMKTKIPLSRRAFF